MDTKIAPTVGRMVYYKARGVFPKKYRAAVVTDVVQNTTSDPALMEWQVRLCVMNPEGLFFTDWVEQGQEGGQWDWMPFQKDQQARLTMQPAVDGRTEMNSTGLAAAPVDFLDRCIEHLSRLQHNLSLEKLHQQK